MRPFRLPRTRRRWLQSRRNSIRWSRNSTTRPRSIGSCFANGGGWEWFHRHRPTTRPSSAGQRSTSAARCRRARKSRSTWLIRAATSAARLIDRLLDRPEYASYFALKWADILQNRGAGYSTSKQRAGTTLFAGWIRDSLAANKPYDQFVTEILTASGSQNENPPAIWYRTVRKSPEYVESVAQAFLGVRIQCAQCHHHPTERWSQADYFGLAAVFSRVGRKGGFADAEVPTDEIIYLKERGEVVHPRTGEILQAAAAWREPSSRSACTTILASVSPTG